MKSEIKGGASFSNIHLELSSGEKIITESGAMASMDSGIDLRSKTNGGFFRAFFMKFLGAESFFINTFTNTKSTNQNIVLTKPSPGQIISTDLSNGQELFIQPGAFIACTPKVNFSLRWAGFSSFIAKEGLFRLSIQGPGTVWYGAFGSIIEKEVNGSYIVDTGHLLSYPKTITLKIQLAGGIFSSFFSGEGFVARLEGKGTIKIQTRSIGGLAGWLNPRFWR